MAHAHVVDLDQVDGVTPALRAFLRVVIRRKTDDAHAGDLVLAGSLALVSPLAHRLRLAVAVAVGAAAPQARFLSWQAHPARRWVAVRQHRRALSPYSAASIAPH